MIQFPVYMVDRLVPVPEFETILLLGTGIVSIAGARRKLKR